MTALIQLRSELTQSANKNLTESSVHYQSLILSELSMMKKNNEVILDSMLGLNLCRKSEHLIPLIRKSMGSYSEKVKMSVIRNDTGFSVTIFFPFDDDCKTMILSSISFLTGVDINESMITTLDSSMWIPRSDFDDHISSYKFSKFESQSLYGSFGCTVN